MNIKERGITVGDLIIITIIIITTTILVKDFNKDKKTSLNLSSQENITFKKFLLSEINLNSLSVSN